MKQSLAKASLSIKELKLTSFFFFFTLLGVLFNLSIEAHILNDWGRLLSRLHKGYLWASSSIKYSIIFCQNIYIQLAIIASRKCSSLLDILTWQRLFRQIQWDPGNIRYSDYIDICCLCSSYISIINILYKSLNLISIKVPIFVFDKKFLQSVWFIYLNLKTVYWDLVYTTTGGY